MSPQPKFAKITIKGTRKGIINIARRGASRITIDLVTDGRGLIENWQFPTPRSFKPDDLTTYLTNLRRVAPSWYEADDSSSSVMAARISGNTIMFSKLATPNEVPSFNLDEIDNALAKAVKAAGG